MASGAVEEVVLNARLVMISTCAEYSVYSFLKNLSEKKHLDVNFFKKTQDVTAEACGISKRTIQRNCLEARKTEETEVRSAWSFFRVTA